MTAKTVPYCAQELLTNNIFNGSVTDRPFKQHTKLSCTVFGMTTVFVLYINIL